MMFNARPDHEKNETLTITPWNMARDPKHVRKNNFAATDVARTLSSNRMLETAGRYCF